MPIYAYQCQACDHELEALQKISEKALSDCPVCGKAALKKLLTAPAFRLKGSGWYETDFKKGNKRNLADDQGSKSGSDGSKSTDSGSQEKKPAAKSEGTATTKTG